MRRYVRPVSYRIDAPPREFYGLSKLGISPEQIQRLGGMQHPVLASLLPVREHSRAFETSYGLVKAYHKLPPTLGEEAMRPRGGLGWLHSVARKQEAQLERGYQPTFLEFPAEYGGLSFRMSEVIRAEQALQNISHAATKAHSKLIPSTYSTDPHAFGAMKMAMWPDIQRDVLKQVLNRPREFVGTRVGLPTVKVSPFTGVQIGGRGVEGLHLPTFQGPFMFGLPRGVLREGVKGLDYLPGEGAVHQKVPAFGTARHPLFVVQPRAMVSGAGGFAVEKPSVPLIQALEQGLENVSNLENPIAVQKQLNKALAKMTRYEGTAYAAWFQQYMHEVHRSTGKHGDYVSLESELRRVDEMVQNKFKGKPATAIQQKPLEYLKLLRELEDDAGRGLHFGVGKVEGFLKHGILASKPLEELTPFGAYSDPARPWIQTTRRGLLMASAIHATPSSLAGGRKTIPYLQTFQEAMAEELHRSMHGAPSSIQAKAAIVLEESGMPSFFGGVNTPHGDVMLGDRFKMNLVRDLSANANLTKAGYKEIHGGLSSLTHRPAWHPTRITSGESLFMGGMKVTELAGYKQIGALKDIDAIMSMSTFHKKMPHEFRKAIVGSVIEQMGRGPQDSAARGLQRTFMKEFAGVFTGPGRKSPVVRWMQEKGEAKDLAKIIFRGGERFEWPQFKKMRTSIEHYNENMMKLHGDKFTPIVPGFTVEQIPILDKESGRMVMRSALVPALEASLRESPHMVEAMLGAAGATRSGLAQPGIHGVKMTSLMAANITTLHPNLGRSWQMMADRMAKAAPSNKETLAMLGSMIAPLLGSKTSAFIPEIPFGKGKYIPWTFEVGQEMAVPAHIQDIKALPRGRITDIKELVGTMFTRESKMWTMPTVIGVEGMMRIGKEEVATKQIVIPPLKMFDAWLKHAEETGKIHPLPLMRRISELISAAKIMKGDVRGGLYDPQLNRAALGYFLQVAEDYTKKDGIIRRMMEPKVAGSGHFSLVPASNIAKYEHAHGAALQFGDVLVNKETAQALGVYERMKKAGSSGIYGMLASSPEQAMGNTAFSRMFLVERMSEGGMAMLTETSKAIYRDTDYDRIGTILNPFKGERDWKWWQAFAKKGHTTQQGMYKAGQLESVQLLGDAVKAEQSKMEELSEIYKHATSEHWEKGVPVSPSIEKMFYTEAKEFATLKSALDKGDPEAFTKALQKTPGSLFRYWSEKGVQAGFAEHMVGRVSATKMATGQIVNTYMRLRKTAEELGKAENIATSTVQNANIAIGHWIQEGTIEKAESAKVHILQLIESFWGDYDNTKAEGVFREGVKNYLTGLHDNVQRSGWRFIPEKAGKVNLDAVADLLTQSASAAKKSGELIHADVFESAIASTVGGWAKPEDRLNMLRQMASTHQQGAKEMEYRTKTGLKRMTDAGFAIPGGTDEALSDVALAADRQMQVALEAEMQKTRDAMESRTFWETVSSPFKRAWEWFKRGPAGPEDKYYNMKRAGIVAAGLLVGGAVAKSFLMPGLAPEIPRESSYVDMAPPMGDFVGRPNHPVVMGKGMGGFAQGTPPIMPMGMEPGAPTPPPGMASWHASAPPAMTTPTSRMEVASGMPGPEPSMFYHISPGSMWMEQSVPGFSEDVPNTDLTYSPGHDISLTSELIQAGRSSIRGL